MAGGQREGAGRPKGSHTKHAMQKRLFQELAKGRAEEILEEMIKMALDEKTPPATRLNAMITVIERAYGKPTEYQEHGITNTLADAFRQAGIKPQSMPIATAQDDE